MTMTETDETTEAASRALVVRPEPASIVRQTVATAEVVEAQAAYHDLCSKLLDKSDYQTIGGKDFRKKSGWRKLAVAFNVSVELISRDYERADNGTIVRAEVVCRATAPNGRTMDGLGACDLFEKCCPAAHGEKCGRGGYHKHCDRGCSGRTHFSNPQHDLPATAMTRATNRACADLFGMGEVSAEEISDHDRHNNPEPDPADPTLLAELEARINGLADEDKDDLRAKWKQNATLAGTKPGDLNAAQLKLAEAMVKGVENKAKARAKQAEKDGGATAAGETPQDAQEPTDGAVAEKAGQDAVEAEIARVKALKPAEVKAELEARELATDGNADQMRKRLVLAVLRDKVSEAEASAPEAQSESEQ